MNPFHGRHFQGEIILWAVRWYCKYGISYRELQEMLAERGVNVDHTTIYRWVQRYAPEIEKRLRWYWRNPTENKKASSILAFLLLKIIFRCLVKTASMQS